MASIGCAGTGAMARGGKKKEPRLLPTLIFDSGTAQSQTSQCTIASPPPSYASMNLPACPPSPLKAFA